jgi:hypothetical protein
LRSGGPPREGAAVLARYEIRVAHELNEELLTAFEGCDVTGEGGLTMIVGEFDQAGLHGAIERIRALGLELVDARKVRIPQQRDSRGSS